MTAEERLHHATPQGVEATASGGRGTAGDAFVLHLPAFEGPLDLLVHLIEQQRLDITEVSVLAVTEQYLAHLRSGERISLTALADFVAMGARLLLLKSRALLPREHADDEAFDPEEDPSTLVAALQEYQRYKRAARHLQQLEEEHRTGYRREAAPPEVELPTGLERVTLDGLVALFREVIERIPPPEQQPRVAREPVRLADRVAALVAELERDGRASFRRLIERAQTRLEVIVDFLAVLELIKVRFLEARQSGAFGDIELVRLVGAGAPTDEELAEDFDGV